MVTTNKGTTHEVFTHSEPEKTTPQVPPTAKQPILYTTEFYTTSNQTSKPPGNAFTAAQSTSLNQFLLKKKFSSEMTLYLSITVCECVDRKNKKIWACGETWTEDCFDKVCVNQKIELTPVSCPETRIPNCPRHQATKVLEGCCETWKCDCKFPK